jgi:hypothetical protein
VFVLFKKEIVIDRKGNKKSRNVTIALMIHTITAFTEKEKYRNKLIP